MTFDGFDAKALSILSTLASADQETYRAHQPLLKSGLQLPAKALIAHIAGELDAELCVGKASVSPLHNDLRFAAAGTPRYKDHLLLTTWQGADRKQSATLWLRLSSSAVGFASGMPFSPAIRDAWREKVAGRAGANLSRAITRVLAQSPKTAEVAGGKLKRVPKPWDDSHPRAELLKHQGFQLRYRVPLPKSVGDAAFASWATQQLKTLMPVHRWLTTELGGAC